MSETDARTEETESDGTVTAELDTEDLRLCFVNAGSSKAYFTDDPTFDSLHHDDWDDGFDVAALYDVDDPYRLVTVVFSGPFQRANHAVSPEAINRDEMEWLTTMNYADVSASVPAKIGFEAFVRRIESAGGSVFIPVGGSTGTL